MVAACGEDGTGAFGDVTLRGDSVTVAAGETATFCVELSSAGATVAATENDLRWDPNCLTLVGRCAVEPTTGKELLSNQRTAAELRAIVISLSDTNAIPDGRLYCCSLRTEPTEGCCPVEIFSAAASDPEGRALAAGTSDGEVCAE
jgi:hypothetical protein